MRPHCSRLTPFIALTLTAVLALAGCGGSDAKPATGDSNAPVAKGDEPPSNDEIRNYFEALASNDAAKVESAMDLAKPGSIAHTYAKYLTENANAAIDGGVEQAEPDQVSKADGGYEICFADDSCLTYDDITYADGKLVSFSVDGNDVGKRITVGNGRAAPLGNLARATLLSSYQSVQSSAMVITLRVQSAEQRVTLGNYEAKYRDSSGRQITTSQSTGPDELEPKSNATVALFFKQAKPGGVLTYSVTQDGGNYREESVKIPTR